ncbi:MAG TPA: porin PorA family protein, partial [Nocardioides sp.]
VRTLENGDPLLDLNLAFTDAQVKGNAADAEDNLGSLNLITKTVPLVGFILGPILLLLGGALLLLGRGSGRRSAE